MNTHRLKGSGYPLQHVSGSMYRDTHGNTLHVGLANVERMPDPKPEPGDNTVWHDVRSSKKFVYSTQYKTFFGSDLYTLTEYQTGEIDLEPYE